MKGTLSQNIITTHKQSFILNGEKLTGILSCGEWNIEKGVIELEDNTRRLSGVTQTLDFDMEFDLSDFRTKGIFLTWSKQGEDASARLAGGGEPGVVREAYRDLVRVYYAHHDGGGVRNPSFKAIAHRCAIKGLSIPEYAMKGTDMGKGKVSIIADDYEFLDMKGNAYVDFKAALAGAIPNIGITSY